MAQNYLTGRLNRFNVGVPGFTTSTDLVLGVDGALGIDTSDPRGSLDTPEISIRGDLIDANQDRGAVGYFLTQDAVGVKWVAASPSDLTFVRVFENDVQVGVSSFSGLNFKANDEFFININSNPGDPNLADINFNNPWVKTQQGSNFSLGTNFGPDGSFWSIPGYGTSAGPVGFVSIGVGTNRAQDDFQVGIGSTGVTLNGEAGRVRAIRGEFREIKVDGGLEVESLIVDPGIATFRGGINVEAFATFTGTADFQELVTAQEIETVSIAATNATAGILTVGIDSTTDALDVIGTVDILGFTTTTGNVFIAGVLTVTERFDVPNIGVEFLTVSGIATINELDLNVGVATELTIGVSTISDLSVEVGTANTFYAEDFGAGIGTFISIDSDFATIGLSTINQADITVADVGDLIADDASIDFATIGINSGFGLIVNGDTRLNGFTTTTSDVFVSGILTVTERFDVPNIGVEFLTVSGIATINQLEFSVGIGTTLTVESDFISSGFATFTDAYFNNLVAETAEIGGIDFPGLGDIAGNNLDFDTGRIGILTGDLIQYGIGTITTINSEQANLEVAVGSTLIYSGNSQINGVNFTDDLFEVNRPYLLRAGVGTLDNGPKDGTGFTTTTNDFYVGNDLYVAGEQFIEQLNTTNIDVSGIATIRDINQTGVATFNSGFATSFNVENLTAGIATVNSFIGTESTITDGTFEILRVYNLGAGTTQPGQAFIDAINAEFISVRPTGQLFSPIITVSNQLTVTGSAQVSGILTSTSQFDFQDADGVNLDVDNLDVDQLNVNSGVSTQLSVTGIITTNNLNVTGFSTFSSDVDINSTAFIDREIVGISTIDNLTFNIGVGTDLEVEKLRVGVLTANVGVVTTLNVEESDTNRANIGIATVGFTSIGTGSTTEGAMFVVGVNTFIGFTTFTGNVFIEGDLDVTGITSFNQLDAAQSQIGILTVFDYADLNGFVDAETVAITSSLTVSGVTTLTGFTTTSDVIVGGALTVVGDTTFLGIVSITDTLFVNQEVTGISTVNNLEFNVGVGTTASIENLDVDREVVGISTITLADITETEIDLATISVAVISQETVGISTISDLSADVAGIGTATIGVASITESQIGVATISNLTVIEQTDLNTLEVLGVSTFQTDVFFQSDINVLGLTNTLELIVDDTADIALLNAGPSTITQAEVGFATITDAYIGVATVGFDSTRLALDVTGLSRFVGFATFTDVFVGSALTVAGIASFSQLDGKQSQIGILTVTTSADIQGTLNVSGVATFTDLVAEFGDFDDIEVDRLEVTGIATIPTLEIENDLTVKRNFQVLGISSLGSTDPVTGFTTVIGDLYVGGDLFVLDDIFYDEITGRNLNISGVATIANLEVTGITTTEYLNVPLSGFGTIARLDGTELDYSIAQIGELDADTVNVSVAATISRLDVTNSIGVGGTSEFVGFSTFGDSVAIANNLNVGSALDVVGSIFGASLQVDTVIQGDLLDVNTGFADTFTVTDQLTATNINSAGLSTFANVTVGFITATGVAILPTIQSNSINNSGLITSNTLTVFSDTILEDLTISGDVNVVGVTTINSQVTINSDLTVAGITTTTSLDVLGIGTVNSLVVENQFNASGLSSFNDGLFVYGAAGLDVRGSVRAWSGIITSLSGEDLTYDNALFLDNIEVQGITTTTNLDVLTQSTLNNLSVVGVASFANEVVVGGTLELSASKATSNSLASISLFSVDLSLFTEPPRSFDIVIQAVDDASSNVHTTKIMAVQNGTDAFFNEYGTVFSSGELAEYDVLLTGTLFRVIATPASANPTTYSITVSSID